MRPAVLRVRSLLLLFGALPALAMAHAFTAPYTLPVPFATYALATGAALVLSFVIVGWLAAAPRLTQLPPAWTAGDLASGSSRGMAIASARVLSGALLALTIVSGLVGTRQALLNFNMTFFWIVFVLAVPYAVALFGDFYSVISPWGALVQSLERAGFSFNGVVERPDRWGYGPACLLYAAFIWIELFGGLQPRGLSIALLIYTGLNVAGAWLLGTRAWFEYGEFFGVMLRLIGRMSPWTRSWGGREQRSGRSFIQPPFVGLLNVRVQNVTLVVFILFMLSSTAFDGFHATLPFGTFFWAGIYPVISPWFPYLAGQRYSVAADLFYVWQWGALLISPFLYLAIFAAAIWAAKIVTGTNHGVRDLLFRFAPTLVPIAFVYHVTHYYTLLFAQGGQLIRLLSDPFGKGWDVFGTANMTVEPFMIDVNTIWHTQVGLILLGHVVSVYLAHVEALSLFHSPRRAALSQMPMLVLMVTFTTLGLWILSLPLAASG